VTGAEEGLRPTTESSSRWSRWLATAGHLLLFVLLLGACTFLVGAAAGALAIRDEGALAWLNLAAAFAATWVMLRFVERLEWSVIGLGRAQAAPSVLGRAFVLGAAAIAVPTLLLAAGGWLRFSAAPDGSWWRAAATASWVLVPAALLEEVVVRGYAFSAMRRTWGAGAAIAVTSLVFGVLHLANPGATLRSIGLVTLAGIFLGAVVLTTGSVWAAWMTHLAWNWTMAVLLHASVSGLPFATPDYVLVDVGPDWATGGVWGPEGGAGAAVGMLGGLGYLIARRRRREERTTT